METISTGLEFNGIDNIICGVNILCNTKCGQ